MQPRGPLPTNESGRCANGARTASAGRAASEKGAVSIENESQSDETSASLIRVATDPGHAKLNSERKVLGQRGKAAGVASAMTHAQR